jgi:hypothetical protein
MGGDEKDTKQFKIEWQLRKRKMLITKHETSVPLQKDRNKVFTFTTLPIFSCAIQIYQIIFIRCLGSGYTQKYFTIIVFYNTCYLNSIRHFKKILIFINPLLK